MSNNPLVDKSVPVIQTTDDFKSNISIKKPIISPELNKCMTLSKIKEIFKTGKGSYNGNTVTVSTQPFLHCLVENFLCSPDGSPATEFLNVFRNRLLKLKFCSKSNDLYKFHQTNELMVESSKASHAKANYFHRTFCSILHDEILPWLRSVADFELNNDIDMFCAKYSSTDYLLCHDDELEGRCFAYVYYLTPGWTSEDGGSLDLFDSKEIQSGIFDPKSIVRSVVPVFNSFILFQVSPKSFHQVAEVLSESKTRLSLTGWFHGKTAPRPSRLIPIRQTLTHYSSDQSETPLADWINNSLLNLTTQGSIQEQFVEDSEILLQKFLLNDQLNSLRNSLSTLNDCADVWEACGPPNKCKYERLKRNFIVKEPSTVLCMDGDESRDEVESALKRINSLIELFHSEEFFLYLSNITGLSFHPMAVDSDSSDDDDHNNTSSKRPKLSEAGVNAGCRFEFRRWNSGCYTLVRDTDDELGEYALDVNIYFSNHEWEERFGGMTSYISPEETEELLTIIPSDNDLAITYRDRNAIRFVKYVNHTAIGTFYDLSLVYYE